MRKYNQKNEILPIEALLKNRFATATVATPKKQVYKYPYMDRSCIAQTINNGKRLAEEFNKQQTEKSAGIAKINRELRLNLRDCKHSTEQKVLWQEFKIKHKLADAEPMAYNQKVVQFNHKHGTNFLMRTYKPLRNEIAVTFSFLVNFYAAQIRDNNRRKLNAGVTTVGTLPRMLTNSESIKRYKIEGVKQCLYKNDAILKHVHNLVEAGLLINYKSHGRNVGFSVEFNPEILAVSDYKTQKSQNLENVPFTFYKTCKSTYSDSNTRTILNDHENKGDAITTPEIRNGVKTPTSATGNFNKNTKSVANLSEKANFKTKNSAETSTNRQEKQELLNRGPAEKNTQALSQKIQDSWQLCKELSENQYVNHIPHSQKSLETEAKTGTMSQPEFRTLLFQEFLKYISRLKKENQSAAGAFYKALQELEDKKLKNFAGRYYTKPQMLEEFNKWLWCVDHAEKWGKKRNWQFLFINDYLDVTRRDAKEMGFWYIVYKIYPQNELKKANRKKERQKRAVEAQERKKKIKAERRQEFGNRSIKPNTRSLTDYEKARAKVRKYLYQEISFEELHRYCRHNLNENIVNGLKNLIDAEMDNLRKYKA